MTMTSDAVEVPEAAHTPLLRARAYLEIFQAGADVIVTEHEVRHRARVSRALHYPTVTDIGGDGSQWTRLQVRAVALPLRDPPLVWTVDVAALAECRIQVEHIEPDTEALVRYVTTHRDAHGVTGMEYLATLFESQPCEICGGGADVHSVWASLFGLWRLHCDTLQS